MRNSPSRAFNNTHECCQPRVQGELCTGQERPAEQKKKASAPEVAGEKKCQETGSGGKSFVAGRNRLLQHGRHTWFQFCFLYHIHQKKNTTRFQKWLSNPKPSNLQLPIPTCNIKFRCFQSFYPLFLINFPGANQLHSTEAFELQPNCCLQGQGTPARGHQTALQSSGLTRGMPVDPPSHDAAPRGAVFLLSLLSITPTHEKVFESLPHPP